ncbi:hypothetical protein [Brachyspira hampsonii]|uniref:hypothetical protein n=1 Tax=Brachyspira hampsonii TaxID=1287055 RepID=UPI000D38E0DE|nr:hypothetical protein [Brachyspira hampsonii]PTY39589.1 hypothetical protein DQ06_02900 [Brachyspira hampsonii bv. II]
MKNVFILAIILIIFASSCKKEYGTEYSIYEYEKYISKLIANRDTLEFTANFLQSLDENIINTLNEMTLVYELTPANIIESIKNRGALYQRIFSDNDDSLCNYLPKDGGYYDVSVTYKKYKDVMLAQIEYPSFNKISENSIEFVAIYFNDKWNLITVNFLNI